MCSIAGAEAWAAPPTCCDIAFRLTDPAWLEATPVTGFIQRELHEGSAVTERTEVRIVVLIAAGIAYFLYAPHHVPNDRAVQQSGARVDRERAVRVAQHGRHGIVRRLQRGTGSGWLLPVGSAAGAIVDPQVYATVWTKRVKG